MKKLLYILPVIFLILAMYILLPAINIHSIMLWILVILFISCEISVFYLLHLKNKKLDEHYKKAFDYTTDATLVIVVVFAILLISGIKLFHVKAYQQLLGVQEGDYKEVDLTNPDMVAVMDTDTAKALGSKTTGALGNVASQYEVSDEYATFNDNGKPMKLAPLKYKGLFSYLANKEVGIPGYIIVDPVNGTAKYIELKESQKISNSAFFGNDLYRYVWSHYPTKMIYDDYFELNNNGIPYYVLSTYKTTIGFFGGKVIDGAVLVNTVTGECNWYAVEDIPSWVDVVYPGDYIVDYANNWGKLIHGYFNFSGKDKKVVSSLDDVYDYGYVAINDDLYLYTGITGVSSDASNIGILLVNERTGKSTYYPIAGVDEESAMNAAEGEVQQYGYEASYPALISIDGNPAYAIALVDTNHLIKEYAIVDYIDVTKVSLGSSVENAIKNFIKKDTSSEDENEDSNKTLIEMVSYDIEASDDSTKIKIVDADGNTWEFKK